MEQGLSIQRTKVYPGSSVSVKWMGVWYDGSVTQIGPQNNLLKVRDAKTGHEVLIESKQMKQLDSKFTQLQEKRFAFNDGDSWLEVIIMDSNATGLAKISWRKNVHSLENETWFVEKDIAPLIQSVLQKDSLQASKSGLFPVTGIEEQRRTIKNVMYQSDSESDEAPAHDYMRSRNARPSLPHPRQSIPAQVNHFKPSQTSSRLPMEPPQHSLAAAPIMPPPLFSQIAPKPPQNIAQSSLPCVWSYNIECAVGIAPHYTSNFFHRLRERKQARSTKGKFHNGMLSSNQSSLKYQSQSQQQTMKRNNNGDADEEMYRRHSLYDQFLLNRHQDVSQTRPARRAQTKLQGLSPKIVSESPGMINAKLGSNVLLTCTATGTMPIEYSWLKDGSKLSQKSPKITYPGPGLLQINETATQDEGIYSCEVSNMYGSAVRYFNLAIQSGGEKEKKVVNLGVVDQVSFSASFDKSREVHVDVQEYLDAIVDEFRILENENEYDMQDNSEPKEDRHVSSPVPKISVTKALNDDMEHYLFGYGENYGQLSSSNILPDELQTQRRVESDLNSIEVHTSLDSSQSELEHNDHQAPMEMQLPTEVESVFDQVQRFHSSMEQNEFSTHKTPQRKWFNRIFSKKK